MYARHEHCLTSVASGQVLFCSTFWFFTITCKKFLILQGILPCTALSILKH